ncbi:1580_t:CDS:1, partial [Ambispora leptoticha]
EKLLGDTDELLTETDTLNLAIQQNLLKQEVYTITQEVTPKIGPLTPSQGAQFR